jgi:hypothetical protein
MEAKDARWLSVARVQAPLAADVRKADDACCANMATDPLYSETGTTLRIDVHSFRRAFNSALTESRA